MSDDYRSRITPEHIRLADAVLRERARHELLLTKHIVGRVMLTPVFAVLGYGTALGFQMRQWPLFVLQLIAVVLLAAWWVMTFLGDYRQRPVPGLSASAPAASCGEADSPRP